MNNLADLEAESIRDEFSADEGAQMSALRGVLSDAEIEGLRERNAQRLERAQRDLGSRWVLAPTRLEQAA